LTTVSFPYDKSQKSLEKKKHEVPFDLIKKLFRCSLLVWHKFPICWNLEQKLVVNSMYCRGDFICCENLTGIFLSWETCFQIIFPQLIFAPPAFCLNIGIHEWRWTALSQISHQNLWKACLMKILVFIHYQIILKI